MIKLPVNISSLKMPDDVEKIKWFEDLMQDCFHFIVYFKNHTKFEFILPQEIVVVGSLSQKIFLETIDAARKDPFYVKAQNKYIYSNYKPNQNYALEMIQGKFKIVPEELKPDPNIKNEFAKNLIGTYIYKNTLLNVEDMGFNATMVVGGLSSLVPALKEEISCPECKNVGTLNGIIQHLNDGHKWTRNAIADWLESTDLNIEFREQENDK